MHTSNNREASPVHPYTITTTFSTPDAAVITGRPPGGRQCSHLVFGCIKRRGFICHCVTLMFLVLHREDEQPSRERRCSYSAA